MICGPESKIGWHVALSFVAALPIVIGPKSHQILGGIFFLIAVLFAANSIHAKQEWTKNYKVIKMEAEQRTTDGGEQPSGGDRLKAPPQK